MDTRKIEMLFTVLQTGSFNKAAEQLHCSQPAVTQTMNQLEEELGCRILKRDHSGVCLSAAGVELLSSLQAVMNSVQELQQKAQALTQRADAELRIGSLASIANTWLPKLLNRFAAEYPSIHPSIRIGSGDLSDWLNRGEIDIAFGDSGRCPGARFEALMPDHYMAVFHKDARPRNEKGNPLRTIRQEEFAEHPLLCSIKDRPERFMKIVSKQQIPVNSDDDATLVAMVANGLGTAVIPQLCLHKVPESVVCCRLKPEPYRELGFFLPKYVSRNTQLLAEFIRRHREIAVF